MASPSEERAAQTHVQAQPEAVASSPADDTADMTTKEAKEPEPAALTTASPHEHATAESEAPAKSSGETEKPAEKEKPAKEKNGVAADTNGAAADDEPPPLPDEPLPDVQEDDGWDPMWSEEHGAWYFFNRFTQKTQWNNPRVPDASASAAAEPTINLAVAGGYNPAIHGDYDPTAWYAQGGGGGGGGNGNGNGNGNGIGGIGGGADDGSEEDEAALAAAAAAGAAVINGDAEFLEEQQHRYSHDAKARRQMNAYFDVDAAASAHDGRSLKAERSGKRPSRSELKAFREKRRAKKEEKRRAWLRD